MAPRFLTTLRLGFLATEVPPRILVLLVAGTFLTRLRLGSGGIGASELLSRLPWIFLKALRTLPLVAAISAAVRILSTVLASRNTLLMIPSRTNLGRAANTK